MVQIKANFEKQCLQRCVSIRAELERFPAYSRIALDGRQIPMVMLKIPYVKEEMYEQRMSEYIDAIVAKTDSRRRRRSGWLTSPAAFLETPVLGDRDGYEQHPSESL